MKIRKLKDQIDEAKLKKNEIKLKKKTDELKTLRKDKANLANNVTINVSRINDRVEDDHLRDTVFGKNV